MAFIRHDGKHLQQEAFPSDGQGRATSVLRDLLMHITYVAEVSTVLKYLVFIKHKNGSIGINYRVCLFVFFLLNKVKMLSVSDPSESS